MSENIGKIKSYPYKNNIEDKKYWGKYDNRDLKSGYPKEINFTTYLKYGEI